DGSGGTWSWSYPVPQGGASDIPVTIVARDSQGATGSTVFYLNPAVLEVTTTADEVDANDGLLSLREAIHLANAWDRAAPPLITSASGLTGTIRFSGEQLKHDVIINGPGADQLTVSGITLSIWPQTVRVSISGLTLENRSYFAISNDGTLRIDHCVVRDSGWGGAGKYYVGVRYTGTMDVSNSLLTVHAHRAVDNLGTMRHDPS